MLVKNAQNLMSAVVRTIRAAEAACMRVSPTHSYTHTLLKGISHNYIKRNNKENSNVLSCSQYNTNSLLHREIVYS